MPTQPRERTMPLVPEPFRNLAISRQSVFMKSRPIASTWARFCPNLNIPQYREPLSEEKKTELDQRALKLCRRAIGNQLHKSSEFSWEVCAWHDVFGLILDDEGLRIDKRPYEFVAKDDEGRGTVKTRVPDATFGLKTYDSHDLKRGYICEVPDCKIDHGGQQPDKRLSKDRLHAMMYDAECGLVVDGVWGKTDIVFPFAVYEAKKRAGNYEAAEAQIYHACKTYLAMLDDLARDPNNVAEYQTKESSQYQLFAFTSCGSYWEVFLAWNWLNDCTVETIWEGDVKEFRHAYDLICIMDQIHDYVVRHHRPFVMNHLEAWHARHQKLRKTSASLIPLSLSDQGLEDMVLRDSDSSDLDSGSDDGDTEGSMISYYDAEFTESVVGVVLKPPEWFRLKEAAKSSRREKAQRTRARNRELRRRLLEGRDAGNPRQMKRGRGRPPKAGVAKKGANKRGRGRPSKTAAKAEKS